MYMLPCNQKQLTYEGAIEVEVIKPKLSNIIKHNFDNVYLLEPNFSYCNDGYRRFDNEAGLNLSIYV